MTKASPMQFSWRTQYDQDRDEDERAGTAILCEDATKTIQDAPDTDINELMARFGVTDGSRLPTSIPELGLIDPSYYGDFTESPSDLRDALDRTREAEARFQALPAHIRASFGNDPYALLEWVQDERNADEAVELGLLSRRPPQGKPIATPSQQTGAQAPKNQSEPPAAPTGTPVNKPE